MWPFGGQGSNQKPKQNERSGSDRRGGRAGRAGGQTQSQKYIVEDTQTQQQAVFLGQTRTCLKTLDVYLEKIMEGAEPELLSAAGGTLNSLIQLMDMSSRDMMEKGMDDGVAAAEGLVREYEDGKIEKCYSHARAAAVLENATELLMRSLHGEQLPVIPVVDSGATTAGMAANSVNNFIMGAHEVEKIRDEAGTNERQYRAKQREQAEQGRSMDAYRHREADVAVLTSDLRGRLITAVGAEEALRMSRQELKRMQEEKRSAAEALRRTRVDAVSGAPDLGYHSCDSEENVRVVTLDETRTRVYVKEVDAFGVGQAVDAHHEMFGGLWAPAWITNWQETVDGAKIFRVKFDNCGGREARDVSYGGINEIGAMRHGQNVWAGDEMVLDNDLVGAYCAWKKKRSPKKKTRNNRNAPTNMEVDY